MKDTKNNSKTKENNSLDDIKKELSLQNKREKHGRLKGCSKAN